ncbi:MAG: glycosyltransferase family 4 protein [bacterium]|nr:glycosyltransferase family 4 protein [bacterium]
MNKLLVFGAFAFRFPYYDGQTIKTRNLLTLLQDKGVDVDHFDTQDFKVNRLSFIRMFWKVMRCKTLYYLPAQNNLTYLFPIIYWLSFIFHIKIHYFVVGGWLAEFLEDKPRLRNKLSKIAGIHCETHCMKNALEKGYGFRNVDVFPNFRISDFHPKTHHEENKLKLVFMARIIKMKGLDLIFELGNRIAEKGLQDKISVDFYGPQQDEEDDIEYFNSNVARFEFMKYYGPLEPSDIYTTLEKYDTMLLPTHFFTEGLPGSILDAYISGIPVIVTKWKYATEFVDDGITGIIIPFKDDGSALFEAVMRLYEDTALLNRMKGYTQEKWHEFSSEKAWRLLQNY